MIEDQYKYDCMHHDYYMACGRVFDVSNFVEMLMSILLFEVGKVENNNLTSDKIDSLTFEEKKLYFITLKKEGKLKDYKPYKRVIDDLNNIQRLRNVFAHGVLHTGEIEVKQYNRETFYLIKYKPDKGQERHTINIRVDNENLGNNTYSVERFTSRGNRFKDWIQPFFGF